ncbi:MAG: HAMP domain-containing histidine kinase [Anaerolineae bacterium]|nr:HAMP domain-containing histidine kinase [Anaerolineae bacterium]
MSEFAEWIKIHKDALIAAATDKMVCSDTLRSQVEEVEESVADFFKAFGKAVEYDNPRILNAILVDWIEARPVPTHDEGETSGLLPALSTLKEALWEQIIASGGPDTIAYIQETERIFTEATHYLASLESEALLSYVRADLEKAKNNLLRLDKRKSDFIAVAAHELKTPLTLIEGYNNMLNAQFPADKHPDVALLMDGIAKGAGRLREIIQDMIDVSMIDMSLIKLHFQPVWIQRLIDAVQFDLREKLQMRRIDLIVERDKIPTLPTYADPERLYQVFSKIVSNAIKYTPDGGVITVSANELPGFVDVTVTDNGIGIEPEKLTLIFEKFSSQTEVANHSSGKVKFKGSGPGLGLAIAKGLVEAHGGTIWAESEGYDEERCPGSTFHIMVPVRSAPSEDHMATLFAQPNSN